MAINVEKVKKVVKNNFNISMEKYFEFENRYKLFYNMAVSLGKFINMKPNDNVLDVGCGYGVSTLAITENFKCNVIGIDLSDGMVNFGKKLFPELTLMVGDGEYLEDSFKNITFDKIVYNASIFIFPDTLKAFESARRMLKDNGTISFSHYPEIVDTKGNDLINIAYEIGKFEKPKSNVISSLFKCIENLEKSKFKDIEKYEYSIEFDAEFLINFFTIPAQSASLFPKVPYEQRIDFIERLFKNISNREGLIKWPIIKAIK